MSSPLGGKRNVKIFVLYLMQNVGIPLDFLTLNDMVMQTDYVMGLDFVECFYELLDDSLIVELPLGGDGEGEKRSLYGITHKGQMVAEQLRGDLVPTILEESLRCALRFLDFKRWNIATRCRLEPNADGSVEFFCSFEQNGKMLFEQHIHVDSMARAKQMETTFRDRPENIYKGMWALLCGNMNYLFS